MEIELTSEEVGALKRMLVKFPMNPTTMSAIYISPSQALRNRADEMEQEDRDYPQLQSILKKLSAPMA